MFNSLPTCYLLAYCVDRQKKSTLTDNDHRNGELCPSKTDIISVELLCYIACVEWIMNAKISVQFTCSLCFVYAYYAILGFESC